MCMIDDADGSVTMLGEAFHVARKQHRCVECRRTIEPGERYLCERFVWESALHFHKTCAHCQVARQWLKGECGGYVYGSVEGDLREHVTDAPGEYAFGVYRLAVGMQTKWQRKYGSPGLRPLPTMPATTHERSGA
jgi:hypothetical protein